MISSTRFALLVACAVAMTACDKGTFVSLSLEGMFVRAPTSIRLTATNAGRAVTTAPIERSGAELGLPLTVVLKLDGTAAGSLQIDAIAIAATDEIGHGSVMVDLVPNGLARARIAFSSPLADLGADLGPSGPDGFALRDMTRLGILSFTERPQAFKIPSPGEVAVGDFDGDGNDDFGVLSTDSIWWCRGAGDGGFTRVGKTTVKNVLFSPVVGDFNQDGRQDLAVAEALANESGVHLLEGRGDFTFTVSMPLSNVSAGPLAASDLKQDGTPDDLVMYDNAAGAIVGLVNQGGANFTAYPPDKTAEGSPRQLGVAPLGLNGPTTLDVVLLTPGGLKTYQAAHYWSFLESYNVGVSPSAFVIRDLQRDKQLDIAATDYASGSVFVLLNKGAGFAPPTSFISGNGPTDIAAADVNADGFVDLIVLLAKDATFAVHLGKGNGTFAGAQPFATGLKNPNHLTLIDVDRDMLPDVIFTSTVDGAFTIMHNTLQ